MWNKIKAWFKKPIEIEVEITKEFFNTPKSYRKPSDTTKLTQGMYDFVIAMKATQEEHNAAYGRDRDFHYETTEDLCAYLNMVFGTNFSRSKLTRIWSGHVNREDLPEGITYTIPF